MCILYMTGPDLYIANWLFRENQTKNKDEEMKGMKLSIYMITAMADIPSYMSIHNILKATQNGKYLQEMKELIVKGWPFHRNEMRLDLRPYWTFRDKLAIMSEVAMKGK